MQFLARCRVDCKEAFDLPFLVWYVGTDQVLPLDDHPDGHGLHPACTESTCNSFPEQWGYLVSNDSIDDSSCLLRIDTVHVDCMRVGEGLLDLRLRYRVEHDTLGFGWIDLQLLGQVPGDGFTLAVEVRCEPDFISTLGEFLQVCDHLLAAR